VEQIAIAVITGIFGLIGTGSRDGNVASY
jgi:hypothetical protein